jgi:hypothetical protein
MRRARKRSVTLAAIAVLLALFGWAPAARAFHAGNVFDKPAGAGGGGGLFYTGAAKEHGWDCTACHTDSEGKIKLSITSDPPDLLRSFRYEPGKTYAIDATLVGEHLGAGPSNFNAIAVAFLDPSGAPAGEISGYAADELYNGGPSTIVSAGQHPGVSKWSFKWTAPTTGQVKLHMAAVDGNGANGEGGGTLTDPFGDDVFVGSLAFDGPTTSRRSRAFDPSLALFGVACVLGIRRRKAR